jgi:hypothetical protein
MADSTRYVAIANFSLNLDNGQKQMDVRVGDEMMFDGLYVECKGEKGTARSLGKVVGEWIRPSNGRPVVAQAPVTAVKSRNATGGRILESSEVSNDLDTMSQQESSNAELKRLVNQYDTTPPPTHISQRVTDDMVDIRKEVRVTVENQDDQEVAKVSSAAKTNAEKNITDVSVGKQESKKSTVISQEERVVKKTAYTKKEQAPAERKHLKVDKEGSGVEVRKVSAPAVHKNDVRSSTAESHKEVSVEHEAVIETNYGTQESTDVGSSTQAMLEQDIIMKKTATPTKREIIREASQEGVVVRKVSKIPEEKLTTQEGITSRVTVSSGGDIDNGEVTFSSNSDIVEGEATFSKTSDAVVDLGGGNDGDIDVNDILDGV